MKSGFKHGAYLFLNTPEIREKLEKLGYKKKNRFGVEGGSCIFTYPHYREDCPNEIYPHYTECTEEYFKGSFDWCADRINCGTDINKFYAVISERN